MTYKGLKNLEKIVTEMLENDVRARSSDDWLYVDVCNYINPTVKDMPFVTVMAHPKHYGLPTYEGVSRTRRKVVNKLPYLKPDDDVSRHRRDNIDEYVEYARS